LFELSPVANCNSNRFFNLFCPSFCLSGTRLYLFFAPWGLVGPKLSCHSALQPFSQCVHIVPVFFERRVFSLCHLFPSTKPKMIPFIMRVCEGRTTLTFRRRFPSLGICAAALLTSREAFTILRQRPAFSFHHCGGWLHSLLQTNVVCTFFPLFFDRLLMVFS